MQAELDVLALRFARFIAELRHQSAIDQSVATHYLLNNHHAHTTGSAVSREASLD